MPIEIERQSSSLSRIEIPRAPASEQHARGPAYPLIKSRHARFFWVERLQLSVCHKRYLNAAIRPFFAALALAQIERARAQRTDRIGQLAHVEGYLSRSRSLPVLLAAFFSLVVLNALTACSQLMVGPYEARGDADVFDKIRAIDLLPRFPQQAARDQGKTTDQRQAAIYPGSVDPPSGDPQPASAAAGDGYELSF